MHVHRFLLRSLLSTVPAIKLTSLRSAAQYEINGSVCMSKLSSDRSNYKSGYKPPDWWIDAWKWAREIARWLYGTGRENAVLGEHSENNTHAEVATVIC